MPILRLLALSLLLASAAFAGIGTTCFERLAAGPLPVATADTKPTPFFPGGAGYEETADEPLFSDRASTRILRQLAGEMGPSNQIEIFDQADTLAAIVGTGTATKIQNAAEALVSRGASRLPPGTQPFFMTAFLRWNTTAQPNAGAGAHRDGGILTILKRLHRPERQSGTIVEPEGAERRTLDPTKVSYFAGYVLHRAGPKPESQPDLYLQIRLGSVNDRLASLSFFQLGAQVKNASRAEIGEALHVALVTGQVPAFLRLLAAVGTYRYDIAAGRLRLPDGSTLLATVRASTDERVRRFLPTLERRRDPRGD